ncbi:MAG: signal peptidase I [Clostridia bacterium]|nr:signal peptidase I [Clostridia bacterium]
MSFSFEENKNENVNGFQIDEEFVAEVEDEKEEENEKKRNFSKELIEWLEVVSTAIIAVVLIFSFVFRIATISGDSMLNTLIGGNQFNGNNGDKVIITNIAYEPDNGDIVVISRNVENSVAGQLTGQGPIIKRVIAKGGQTVDIDFENGIVYVDGVALKEDYISTPTTTKADVEFPVYVPEGYIFVLGDNRQDSLDSRFTQIGNGGLIDTRYVLGHAIYRIYPFNRIGRLDNK